MEIYSSYSPDYPHNFRRISHLFTASLVFQFLELPGSVWQGLTLLFSFPVSN